ncbi:replication initiator [Streptomyces sp. NPDC004270]
MRPRGRLDEPSPTWPSGSSVVGGVLTPYSPAAGELTLHWGTQVDARPLRADGDGKGPDDDAVAAYVTKGASETGAGVDRPLTTWTDIESAPVSEHVRTYPHADLLASRRSA